tara:strand:- start:1091 stop:1501 length:411 start_codon:yes stop_codon:yes gene_type:complete
MINKDNISIFHLAIPTHDLKIAKSFYYDSLGFTIGRIYEDRITFNVYGDQLVCHLTPLEELNLKPKMYPRHFGFTFLKEKFFDDLYLKAKNNNLNFYKDFFLRWPNKPEKHKSFFLCDPSGNLIEFKYYFNKQFIY